MKSGMFPNGSITMKRSIAAEKMVIVGSTSLARGPDGL
jgi:hypothetical protein